MSKTAEDKIYSDVNKIPANDVAVVLGTSRYMVNGYQNQYFNYRMEAAAELYHAGKVKKILVSGDNSVSNYNEPLEMFGVLVGMCVDPEDIVLDFAGFRTFDSVIRSKEIFGQTKITVISQKFHNERAVFIARNNGIEAYGYNAQDLNGRFAKGTNRREFFAKAKVFLDMLIDREPKFLGEKIQIGK